VLAQNIDIAEFFEKVIAAGIKTEVAVPWVTIELFRVLNYNKVALKDADIKVEHFVSLLKLVESGKITPLQAKTILNGFYPKSSEPSAGAGKISDEKEIEKFAKEVIKSNEKAVSDYKSGQKSALNYLLGDIMKLTQKRADFAIARKVLEGLLK